MYGSAVPRIDRSFRPRTMALYLASGVLVVSAIALRNPVPLFLALVFLLAPVAASLASPRGPATVRLAWHEEGAGSKVRIRGTLSGEPPLDLSELEVTHFRPVFLQEAKEPKVEHQGANLAFELRWTLRYPKLATVACPSVIWTDPLGLLETPVTVVGDPLPIERFPPELSRLGNVQLRRTTVLPGEIRSRATGRTGEFFALRAASPTDTPRQINWRATARTGKFLANEFFLERTGDLILILDVRPTELGPDRDAELLSVSGAAAFGIAQAFLNRKSRVGLGLFGEFLEAIPLASGRIQRYRIREALLRARLTSNAGPSERLAVALPRYFPPGVNTIVFSAMTNESARLLLPHLRRRGFPVAVVSPSPIPLLLPPQGLEGPDDSRATRLLELLRRVTVQEVWKDAPIIDWVDFWSLASFVRLLSSPPRNRSVA